MGQDFGDLNIVADVATGGYTSGQRAARAQGEMAQAQEAQQRAERAQVLQAAEATPQELSQLQRSISLNESSIARNEKLLASSDPALIEAGTQALALLRGEEAKTLAPLRNNIQKQEQALRAKLQAQLGSGYENSTAGIQALQAFNQQANDALANAQNATIGQLLGVAQNTSARASNQQGIANAATIGQLFGDIQKRKISAMTGAPITGAGSQFVGDLQSARENTRFINRGVEAAAAAFGAMSGSPAGLAGLGGGGSGGGSPENLGLTLGVPKLGGYGYGT